MNEGPPPMPVDIAKALRRLVGLTQAQVAVRAGLATGTYKRFERGLPTGLTSRLAITFTLLDAVTKHEEASRRLMEFARHDDAQDRGARRL